MIFFVNEKKSNKKKMVENTGPVIVALGNQYAKIVKVISSASTFSGQHDSWDQYYKILIPDDSLELSRSILFYM